MAEDRNDKHSKSKEDALFRQSVSGTQPLDTKKRHLGSSAPPAASRSNRRDKASVMEEAPARSPAKDIEFGEALAFQRPQVPRSVMRQLRRGKFAVQDEMDLHGLIVSEAHERLREFITLCHRRGIKCVRIVHGKGLGSGSAGPVLKTKVNHWLRQWDEVLAFCSTPPRDGGTGAVYVLLGNSRP
jgi:DNA-nicking Smr family endonuclease